MSRRAVLIGDREYPSRGAAQAAVREVLYRYPPGTVVDDADDQALLADLLQLHPDPAAKIGPGVTRFEVRRNWNSPGFWIVRNDGTEADFSYLVCLREPSHEQRVRAVLRHLVIDQVTHFRESTLAAGPARCPVTGDRLTAANAHADHDAPTFAELADAFVAERGGYLCVWLAPSVDGAIGRRLLDPEVEREWQTFHRARARLRLVTARANLGLLRRRRSSGPSATGGCP